MVEVVAKSRAAKLSPATINGNKPQVEPARFSRRKIAAIVVPKVVRVVTCPAVISKAQGCRPGNR